MSYTFPEWPMFDERERQALSEVLESRQWWSGHPNSPTLDFEKRFAAAHGAVGGIATTNGTHALELALRVLDIGPGDDVIVPAMTFIATATCVLAVGANPVPVDSCEDTWCMDPAAFEQAITPRTRAVMPVHFGGQICRMDAITAIAERHGIAVIEDAAHAHGAQLGGSTAGSFGVMAAFSFQNFKLMTAGEGGILLVNDPDLLRRAEQLSNCGRLRTETGYLHEVPGSNFRLTSFQGALLNVQLDRLEELAERRSSNGKALDEALSSLPGIHVQGDTGNGRHARYMYLFRFRPNSRDPAARDLLASRLADLGVPARRIYPRVQDMPFLASGSNGHRACPVASDIADQGIWLHHRVLIGDCDKALEVADAMEAVIRTI